MPTLRTGGLITAGAGGGILPSLMVSHFKKTRLLPVLPKAIRKNVEVHLLIRNEQRPSKAIQQLSRTLIKRMSHGKDAKS